jgi:hypothetical protein
MLAVSTADMYSGDFTAWLVNDGLQRAAGGPACATSPAIEEGAQDAECFLSTDSGFAATSSHLGLCAWTTRNNMTTTPPTAPCQNVARGLPYDRPLQARQPASSPISPSVDPTQLYYTAGAPGPRSSQRSRPRRRVGADRSWDAHRDVRLEAVLLLRHPAQLGAPWHDLARLRVSRVGARSRLEYTPLQLPR